MLYGSMRTDKAVDSTPSEVIIRRPDYTKIKQCSECENSNSKGICKFYMLYAHLRNGCLREQEAAG